MKQSVKFNIAETKHFKEKIKWNNYNKFYKKIYNFIYPQLKENPYFWPNIKKLKWNYKNVYRYRIWKFRLFYVIKKSEIIVIMTDIQQRKDSYK